MSLTWNKQIRRALASPFYVMRWIGGTIALIGVGITAVMCIVIAAIEENP